MSETIGLPVVEPGDEHREDEASERRDLRRWWALVLLLLMALLACGLLQLLLPGARSTLGRQSEKGVTAVFGVYGLHQPLGVAAGPRGEIAVSDTGVQQVLLFDDQGRLIRRIGGDLPQDKVFSVDGLTFSSGQLLVTDWSLRRVWVFDTDGKVARCFPENPTAPAYGTHGLTPYDIVEYGDSYLVSSRDGIYRFDASSSDLQGRFDSPDKVGEPNFVNGIAADPKSGMVYACDTLNRRVVAYDKNGRAVWSLGRRDVNGEIVSFFGLPRGVAITDRGLLVSDTFHHRLYLLSKEDGSLIGWYGHRGVTDGQLNFPEGVDVAPDGLIYLADRENNRIQVVRLGDPEQPDGTMKSKWDANHESY